MLGWRGWPPSAASWSSDADDPHARSLLTAAWQFRGFIRPHARPLAVGATLVVVQTFVALLLPWPLKVIIDGAIGHHPQAGWLAQTIAGTSSSPEVILLRGLAAMALIAAASAALDFLSVLLMEGAGERVAIEIRGRLFTHLQRLSLAYHDRQRVGDLVSRLTLDNDRLQDMLVAVFDTLIPNGLMLVGLAVAMLVIDPGFGLLALAVAPPLFFVTYRYTSRIKMAATRQRQAEAQVSSLAAEVLASIRAVQALSREEHEDGRFAERNRETLDAALTAVRLKAAFTPLVDVVSAVGTALVVYVGIHRVLDGRLTLGLLLVFLAYMKSLYQPMRSLSKLAYTVSRGTASAERVWQVLGNQETIRVRPDARPAPRFRGEVEFRAVSFGYGGGHELVLHQVSRQVRAGESIGIQGRTGAGKSTLVSLIPRFYDPQEGVVLVDGIDIRGCELASLRRQVSLVLQVPLLFFGSIEDNVRYGRPDATCEEVQRVIRAAGLGELTESLPDGSRTLVGERGVTLSGGQRQQVSIARAMLADTPILILDEPTTGLDQESESAVLGALSTLAAGRTTFVISHRHVVLSGTNRLWRVEGGSVKELAVASPVSGRG